MGIDQPKISAMPAGQFRGYSVERLMRFLVAVGHAAQSWFRELAWLV
jgi:predicted XRE-type DNA-binding protein